MTSLLAAIDLTQLGTLLTASAVPIGAVAAALVSFDRRRARQNKRMSRELTGWEGWGEGVFEWRDWADNEISELAAQVRELGGTPRRTRRPPFPVRSRIEDEAEEPQ